MTLQVVCLGSFEFEYMLMHSIRMKDVCEHLIVKDNLIKIVKEAQGIGFLSSILVET